MRFAGRVCVPLAALCLSFASCGVTGPDAERVVLYVGPERVECSGEGVQTCLLVRREPTAEWEYFYNEIEGFEHESGFGYTLLVSVRPVENPPADASSVAWRLIEVLAKVPS